MNLLTGQSGQVGIRQVNRSGIWS